MPSPGLRLGMRVQVTIDEAGGGHCRTVQALRPPEGDSFAALRARGAITDYLVVAMAGIVASGRTGGLDGCGGDIQNIRHKLATIEDRQKVALLREARAAAERIVNRYWPIITILAEQLHSRGSLDHGEIIEILAWHRQRTRSVPKAPRFRAA
jgi:hypothetical protein